MNAIFKKENVYVAIDGIDTRDDIQCEDMDTFSVWLEIKFQHIAGTERVNYSFIFWLVLDHIIVTVKGF